MPTDTSKYKGIYYMLLASLAFSAMSGFVKTLKPAFNSPQLVLYRNAIGLLFLSLSLFSKPPRQTGGRIGLLIARGMLGTFALYTLMFVILHLPLGTAMTYNSMNTFYIALLASWWMGERLTRWSWLCILGGFTGVLFIYRPSDPISWHYHWVGLLHGLFSALAYLSISSLNKHYDTRVIVLSFLSCGFILPMLMMGFRVSTGLPADEFFFPDFRWPAGREGLQLLGMGITALIGQYYVTKAYSHEKAGIVAAIGYSNILFSLIIGIALGDGLPDLWAFGGILLVISSGVLISLLKKKEAL